MPLDFTAIDFETANGSAASACSVGLVKVRDGQVVDEIGWFIQPPFGHDHFVEWNTRIHGITADMVLEAPGWVDQLADLQTYIDGDALVAHNAGFDMGVMKSACAATGLAVPVVLLRLQPAGRPHHVPPRLVPAAGRRDGRRLRRLPAPRRRRRRRGVRRDHDPRRRPARRDRPDRTRRAGGRASQLDGAAGDRGDCLTARLPDARDGLTVRDSDRATRC